MTKPVICGPFSAVKKGDVINIYGSALPWPGSRRGAIKRIDATIAAQVKCGDDGSWAHYPAKVAIAHACLMRSAPDLEAMLQRLAEKTKRANEIQHSGGALEAEDWAELHQLTNEAFGLLAKARG